MGECGLSDGQAFQSGAGDLRAGTAARGQWVGAKRGGDGPGAEGAGGEPREEAPPRPERLLLASGKDVFLEGGLGVTLEAPRTDSFLVG